MSDSRILVEYSRAACLWRRRAHTNGTLTHMTSAAVIEHAVLAVTPGLEDDFEAAFAAAKRIISAMPGFRSLTLSRGVERPSAYLLLVQWDTVTDHEVGFRRSSEYQQWRSLLHHFYEPFPVVEHFTEVAHAVEATP